MNKKIKRILVDAEMIITSPVIRHLAINTFITVISVVVANKYVEDADIEEYSATGLGLYALVAGSGMIAAEAVAKCVDTILEESDGYATMEYNRQMRELDKEN